MDKTLTDDGKDTRNPVNFEFHAEIKEVGDDSRLIEGYASTEDLDRGNDITHREAFKSSLKNYITKNPIVTYMHKWDQPIGKVVEADIDTKGLKVKVQIAKDDPIADRVWNLVKQEVLRAFSFGYKVLHYEDEKRGDSIVRHLKDLELFEVAVVSIPMNRNTMFSVAKGLMYGTDSLPSWTSKDQDFHPWLMGDTTGITISKGENTEMTEDKGTKDTTNDDTKTDGDIDKTTKTEDLTAEIESEFHQLEGIVEKISESDELSDENRIIIQSIVNKLTPLVKTEDTTEEEDETSTEESSAEEVTTEQVKEILEVVADLTRVVVEETEADAALEESLLSLQSTQE
jgi:HK97 family phage prohead protease